MCSINSELSNETRNQPEDLQNVEAESAKETADSSSDRTSISGSFIKEETPEHNVQDILVVEDVFEDSRHHEGQKSDNLSPKMSEEPILKKEPVTPTTLWNVKSNLVNMDDFLGNGDNFAEPGHGLTENVTIKDFKGKNWTVFCPLIPTGMDFILLVFVL